MSKQRSLILLGIVFGAAVFGLVFWQSAQPPWAEEPAAPADSSALPEGSASVIGSLTWHLSSDDSTTLQSQTKAVIEKVADAVIVKENEKLLIVSLPTKELARVRQELDKLAAVEATQEQPPGAPTTLLRLMFVQP